MRGIITKGIAGFYYISAGDELYECKARGLFRKKDITPLCGDVVEFEPAEDMSGFITEILPRKNSFSRPPVANVDVMVLVAAAKSPDPDLGLIDRFTAAASAADAGVVICLNKTDLAEPSLIERFRDIYGGLYPFFPVCGKTGEGTDALREALRGKKAALCGPSGAGKSTITNLLLRRSASETGEISRKTERGKNTTRHSELFACEGAYIFDTPGFTSFDDVRLGAPEALQHCFPEIAARLGECRFADCMHLKEPGCAVTKALEEGLISRSRYDSYVQIFKMLKDRKAY